ncbi:MAG: GNAT family N-acetyltransferase [Brevundimonas sp.]|jgi:amino-acid N-acetyltransferase|uniref:Acetyltransferase n=1 Tax=Brevundimonas vesicularis TaxID=41276 RepID=A0A2X1B9R4_BREVE|nr:MULTISPECIES: GNAT family N-acetyltransferase [Brevundimonas]MCK6105178.1 GNAT family N-acetyltransferase [Brevundimonas sp. EYE_349]SPU53507.1 acetyltransferase [Brevundimonas vesicularis]
MVVLYLIEATDAGLIAALRAEGLPAPDAGRYFSADHSGAVVGYVGLEGEGRDLLLRSLVVLADRKARGLGARVLAAAEIVAGNMGAARLHLLTTTAEPFFARNGYRTANRQTAPEAMRRTREFAGLCPASAAYLIKDL